MFTLSLLSVLLSLPGQPLKTCHADCFMRSVCFVMQRLESVHLPDSFGHWQAGVRRQLCSKLIRTSRVGGGLRIDFSGQKFQRRWVCVRWPQSSTDFRRRESIVCVDMDMVPLRSDVFFLCRAVKANFSLLIILLCCIERVRLYFNEPATC